MNVGYLLPGFSADAEDDAIPAQDALVAALSRRVSLRLLALRYPHQRGHYALHGAQVTALAHRQVRGLGRMRLWLDTLNTLRQMHRAAPFDLLHGTWADETGALTCWAGRWLGIPSVVTLAGGELVGFEDIGYGLQRGAFSRWTVGQALRADQVVALSEYARGRIARAGYAVPETTVIPLGVDVARFTPPAQPAATGQLIHVASLVPIKDQALLLAAFARVAAARPSAHLTVIGIGVCEAALRAQVQAAGIGQQVTFAGKVPHRDLPGWYARAALHLITSRHEAQGLVTLEAAACGLPTLGTRVGILADDDALGQAVPVGDSDALAAALLSLIDDPSRLHAWGERARARVQAAYTVEHTAAALMTVYERALDQRARKQAG